MFDEMYWPMHRKIAAENLTGLVRLDRAILYLRRPLAQLQESIRKRTTKTLGDSSYVISRFAAEAAQLAYMGGDHLLAEEVRSHLRALGIELRAKRQSRSWAPWRIT